MIKQSDLVQRVVSCGVKGKACVQRFPGTR